MDRVRYLHHNGERILYLDFSKFPNPRDAEEHIARAREVIDKEPANNSLRTLTNVEDTAFDAGMAQSLWKLAKANKPYVRAAAVVGITGAKATLLKLVQSMSGREFAVFKDVEAAKHWLSKR